LLKLAPGRNNHFFARLPGSLADYASAVGTDVFRNRSLTSAGVCWAYEVNGNRCRKALLDPAVEKSLARSRTLCRTVHGWEWRSPKGTPFKVVSVWWT